MSRWAIGRAAVGRSMPPQSGHTTGTPPRPCSAWSSRPSRPTSAPRWRPCPKRAPSPRSKAGGRERASQVRVLTCGGGVVGARRIELLTSPRQRELWGGSAFRLSSRNSLRAGRSESSRLDQVAASGNGWHRLAGNPDEFRGAIRTNCQALLWLRRASARRLRFARAAGHHRPLVQPSVPPGRAQARMMSAACATITSPRTW
jgi:hypothetical protein